MGLSIKYARVKYFKYENASLGIARNRGLKKVKDDFIKFLDANDLIEQEKFRIQLYFQEKPESDVFCWSVRYFKNNLFDLSERLYICLGPYKEWMPKIFNTGSKFMARAFRVNFSHLSSPLFKKELILKVGEFNNEMNAVADYHFLLRCVLAGANFHYHYNLETYLLVRWHSNNMSKNMNMMRREEQKMRITLNSDLLDYPLVLASNRQAIQSLEYRLGNSWKKHLLSGGKFEFMKDLITALGLHKLVLKMFYKDF